MFTQRGDLISGADWVHGDRHDQGDQGLQGAHRPGPGYRDLGAGGG